MTLRVPAECSADGSRPVMDGVTSRTGGQCQHCSPLFQILPMASGVWGCFTSMTECRDEAPMRGEERNGEIEERNGAIEEKWRDRGEKWRDRGERQQNRVGGRADWQRGNETAAEGISDTVVAAFRRCEGS